MKLPIPCKGSHPGPCGNELGWCNVKIRITQVKWVSFPYSIVTALETYWVRGPGLVKYAPNFPLDPKIKVAIWFSQTPYNSLIVYEGNSYLIHGIRHERELRDVKWELTGPKYFYKIKSRIFDITKVKLPRTSSKWIRSQITASL